MKNILEKKFRLAIILGMLLTLNFNCDRDISDDAVLAGFSKNGDVFIDGFSAGLEFRPFQGSLLNSFSVDTQTKFQGSASMRFDVPNVGDPDGAFAGAIFPVPDGRDLSGFDALTFWAKGSQAGTINEIGFGNDFGENKFNTAINGLNISTGWKKYIIPIPDPSRLTQEKGLFWFAEGPENGNGYTFWIDELKYEKLGTIAQPRPTVFNGQNLFQQTFIGSDLSVSGLQYTVNSANGQDITVNTAPAFFQFISSNPSVASVNENGQISVNGAGTTTISASLNGIDAIGSLTLESLGEFTSAPTPTRDPANVISIFSDAYQNVPVDFYNGFFNGDGQTTLGGAPPANFGGDNVINYTNLNFVGIGTFLNVAPVNASQMTHFHVDLNVQEAIQPGDFIRIQLINSVGNNETSGSVIINSSQLLSDEWLSLDIPLGEFTGLGPRNQLGLIFFVSDSTISNLFVDNIYYYKEVLEPTPNIDDSAATQVALPIGFESTTLNYDFVGFEGADSAIVANPDPSGINPTSRVMRTTKTAGAQFFAGTFINLNAPINFSSSKKLRMKVWSPKNGIPIRVRLENINNSVGMELDANTTTTNQWEELEWDFASFNPTAAFVRIVVFMEFIPGLPGDGSTYFFDDIQILN